MTDFDQEQAETLAVLKAALPDDFPDDLPFGESLTPANPAAVPAKCRRHDFAQLGPHADVKECRRCGALRDEARVRTNKNNRARGASFERYVAGEYRKVGHDARRTGPLLGRDDVIVGNMFAVQTKKDGSLSLNGARQYLDDLQRTFPDRVPLVIHALPGDNKGAVVILRLTDHVGLHGKDGQAA